MKLTTATQAPAKRKAISTRTRFEVFKRDGFRCMYCGATPIAALLQVDHIVPVASGGGNHMDNLVTSCQPCNAGKAANSLADVPQGLADRAAEVKEREKQIKHYQKVIELSRQRLHDESWLVADLYIEQFRLDGMRKDWFASVSMFVQKLGVYPTIDAMELAILRKPNSRDFCFRYFCGICWRLIKQGAE